MERNPSEISNTLDVLILLNEPEELGLVTNEDLLDFKKYMHKSETIFQKYIMPKKGEIAGYYWFETEEGEISVYRIFYKDGKKILEHAVYKDSKPIHIHQAILKKREGDSKQPYDEIGKKHEDWKKGIIDRESYIEFILKVLENEGMKEWYSGILTFYADHDDWYLNIIFMRIFIGRREDKIRNHRKIGYL